jgi:hypothetical protein
MKYLVFLFILFPFLTNADVGDVKISIEPKKPVKNEVFKVKFEIEVPDSETIPTIDFRPIGAEVISKSRPSYSSSTTYINGNLKTEKKLIVDYDLIAPRSGYITLGNIRVFIDGQRKIVRDERIYILEKAPKIRDIIAVAEVDNKEPYVNQSVVVRYYVYHKIPISTLDIKKFPKLDKYLKRFHNEQPRPERVKYQGQIFTRRVVYTTQIFPSKAGKYTIDPISLLVSYPSRTTNPFGGFGIGFGRNKQITIRSEKEEINVLPLPTNNVPKSFTGLVGVHKFNGTINKNKLLANEPLEIKLAVEGPGALEIFEAPRIVTDATVEEFETTSDLAINKDFTAKKTFDYTYLGRDTTTIDLSNIKFSYFDPQSKKYVETNINLGEVSITGDVTGGSKKVVPKLSENTNEQVVQVEKEINWQPIYSFKNTLVYYAKPILMTLSFIFALISIIYGTLYIKEKKLSMEDPEFLKKIRKQGASNADIVKLITILESNKLISESDYDYLMRIKKETEREYNKENVKKIKIKTKYLKLLQKAMG